MGLSTDEGCAAKPFEKKKIAIAGVGGYLGAVTFGFLQRSASIYGTGIASGNSPRAITATGTGAEALNKVLTPCFRLAYAGEDLVRLCKLSGMYNAVTGDPYDNGAANANHVGERLKSFDAVILGTTYQLEQRTVTGNTYEVTPNDKTFEFYLDERYGANEDKSPADDSDTHIEIFKTAIQACKESGTVKHVVVLETLRTKNPSEFVNVLENEEGITYTYIRLKSPLKKDLTFSFEKGVQDKLEVVCLPKGSPIHPNDTTPLDGETAIYREDIAALIVQSLMTFNWGESRIIEVSSSNNPVEAGPPVRNPKYDKEWCPNSDVLAGILRAL
eukprot:scaffold14346_cov207-Alexandrium_tamarense.AAC.8